MKADVRPGAAEEWRRHWALPLAAMIGYSTMGLQSYAIGPFVPHVEQAFGWSRADFMLGISISTAVGIFLNLVVGLVVDRFGPRRVALTGLFVKTGAFAALGTATGTLMNWSLLWLGVAIGLLTVQSTVWTSAVASRFDRSRGLAMAVALSGSPLTAIFAPPVAVWLIATQGWRHAFFGVGALWLAVALPVVFLFFDRRPARAGGPAAPAAPARQPAGMSFREGIRTPAFLRLFLSYGCFSFYSMTMATNLVPLLTETGISAMEAAGIASIMGVMGIVARLTVGLLLDRFPGNLIGTITQLGPVAGCLILLFAPPSVLALSLATALFGAALGAEIDVAIYLATRHFGLRAFAALFGAIIGFGAAAATAGPYVGGVLHDMFGSYDPLLALMMVVLVIGAATMATMPRPPAAYASAGH